MDDVIRRRLERILEDTVRQMMSAREAELEYLSEHVIQLEGMLAETANTLYHTGTCMRSIVLHFVDAPDWWTRKVYRATCELPEHDFIIPCVSTDERYKGLKRAGNKSNGCPVLFSTAGEQVMCDMPWDGRMRMTHPNDHRATVTWES